MTQSRMVVFSISLLLAVCATASAHSAETVRVLDERATTTDDPYSVTTKFVVNNESKELGRAWIETEIDGGYVDADLRREEVFVKKVIPGLKFDPSTREVTYQLQGSKQAVVCGTFSDGNLIKWANVSPTGRCKFAIRTEKRPFDDGYYVRQKSYVMVDMVVQ